MLYLQTRREDSRAVLRYNLEHHVADPRLEFGPHGEREPIMRVWGQPPAESRVRAPGEGASQPNLPHSPILPLGIDLDRVYCKY